MEQYWIILGIAVTALFLPCMVVGGVLFWRRRSEFPINGRLPELVTAMNLYLTFATVLDIVELTNETKFPCWLKFWELYWRVMIIGQIFSFRLFNLWFRHGLTSEQLHLDGKDAAAMSTFVKDLLEDGNEADTKALNPSNPSDASRTWFMTHRHLLHRRRIVPLFVVVNLLLAIRPVQLTLMPGSPFLDSSIYGHHSSCPNVGRDYFIWGIAVFFVTGIAVTMHRLWHEIDSFKIKNELLGLAACAAIYVAIKIPFGTIAEVDFFIATFWIQALYILSAYLPLLRSYRQHARVVKQQLYLNRPRRASSMQLEQAEKPTLDNVMGNPRGFKALEDFLKLEFSVENLLFVRDAATFKRQSEVLEAQADGSPENLTIVHQRAVELYEKYVKTDSPFQINIPANVFNPLKALFEPPKPRKSPGSGAGAGAGAQSVKPFKQLTPSHKANLRVVPTATPQQGQRALGGPSSGSHGSGAGAGAGAAAGTPVDKDTPGSKHSPHTQQIPGTGSGKGAGTGSLRASAQQQQQQQQHQPSAVARHVHTPSSRAALSSVALPGGTGSSAGAGAGTGAGSGSPAGMIKPLASDAGGRGSPKSTTMSVNVSAPVPPLGGGLGLGLSAASSAAAASASPPVPIPGTLSARGLGSARGKGAELPGMIPEHRGSVSRNRDKDGGGDDSDGGMGGGGGAGDKDRFTGAGPQQVRGRSSSHSRGSGAAAVSSAAEIRKELLLSSAIARAEGGGAGREQQPLLAEQDEKDGGGGGMSRPTSDAMPAHHPPALRVASLGSEVEPGTGSLTGAGAAAATAGAAGTASGTGAAAPVHALEIATPSHAGTQPHAAVLSLNVVESPTHHGGALRANCNTFEPARMDVLHLMRTDTFARFIVSKIYKQYELEMRVAAGNGSL